MSEAGLLATTTGGRRPVHGAIWHSMFELGDDKHGHVTPFGVVSRRRHFKGIRTEGQPDGLAVSSLQLNPIPYI